jgi:hypothetical protein
MYISRIFFLYVMCLVTSLYPPLKRVLHRVLSSVFSFRFQYLSFSLRPSSNCLRHLPRLLVFCICPSITSFGRQELPNPVGLPSFYCTVRVACAYFKIIILQSQLAATVPLLTCFREVPNSNLRTKYRPS